jgi:hypothetical protein
MQAVYGILPKYFLIRVNCPTRLDIALTEILTGTSEAFISATALATASAIIASSFFQST